jgi:hypothetical protein
MTIEDNNEIKKHSSQELLVAISYQKSTMMTLTNNKFKLDSKRTHGYCIAMHWPLGITLSSSQPTYF